MNPKPLVPIVSPHWPKGWVPPPQKESESGWRILMGYLLASLVAIPFLIKVSLQDVPAIQQLLAYLLLCICTWPVVSHFSKRRAGLPVFPLICVVYAVSLALPVFYAEPAISTVGRRGVIRIMDADTTLAIGYCLLGVVSMQFGFWLFRFSMLNMLIPCLRLELDPQKGLKLMMGLGFFGVALGSGLMGHLMIHPRYIAVFVLFERVSILSTSYLYVQYLKGELNTKGKMSLVAILFLNVTIGLSVGAVRNALDPFLAIGAVHWMVKRSISWKLAIVAGFFFLIMQAVKGQFRALVLSEGEVTQHVGVMDRVKLWQELAGTVVSRVMVDNKEATASSVRNSFGRMDMIHLFGHAVAETPRNVPFQEGKTYSYFLYMFVPRAIWWNKPTSQAGNEFFGLAYGLQSEDSIGTTSIGLPQIVEAYINFGFFGVMFIMMLLGMFYAMLDRIFNHAQAGAGGVAVYATILFGLVNIETCATANFGNLLQTIIVYTLILRMARLKQPVLAAV